MAKLNTRSNNDSDVLTFVWMYNIAKNEKGSRFASGAQDQNVASPRERMRVVVYMTGIQGRESRLANAPRKLPACMT